MKARALLIVEDEMIQAEDLRERLVRSGYAVAGIATRAAQAVELAERLRPDLVLMDIQLRGSMDGIEAAGQIRRRLGLPVVFLTANSEPSTVARAQEAEPFGYLVKPVDDRELAAAVEIALSRHQAGEYAARLDRLYAVMGRVSQAVLRRGSSHDLLEEACRAVCEQGGFGLAWTGARDPVSDALSVTAWAGDAPAPGGGRADGTGLSAPWRAALGQGQPWVCNEIPAGAEREFWDGFAGAGTGAAAVFPIRGAGWVRGALGVCAPEAGSFQEAEVRLLEKVAAALSMALESLDQEERRRQAEESFLKQREILEQAESITGVGAWEWSGADDRLTVSREWGRIHGVPAGAMSLPELMAQVDPLDAAPMADLFRAAWAGQAPFERIYGIVRKSDGQARVVRAQARVVFDERGHPRSMYGVAQDITEPRRLEEAQEFLLRCGAGQGEDFFYALARFLALKLGMDFVCIDRLQPGGLAARTLAVYNNGQFEDNVSYALEDTPCGEVVGKNVCCHPRDVCLLFPKDEVLQQLQAVSYVGVTLWSAQARPIGLIAVIGRKPMADPALAKTMLQMVAVRAAGELERRDAEEALRTSLREKTVLLKEVHHRVKNNLQIVSSLLGLQARRMASPEAARVLVETSQRVRTMASMHEALYRSESLSRLDMTAYLGSLCEQLIRSIGPEVATRISLDLRLQPVPLGLDQAVPCGLIVNELLTNALKHAFPEGRSGRVVVEFGPAGDNRAALVVADDGAGCPPGTELGRSGALGGQLVASLAAQLGGTVTTQPSTEAGGTRVCVDFPVRPVEAAGG